MSELSNAKLFIQILTKMWDADRREKIARHNDSVKRSVGHFVRNFSPDRDPSRVLVSSNHLPRSRATALPKSFRNS